MTRPELLAKLQEVISDHVMFQDIEITEDTDLTEDLGFDSLDEVALSIACEDKLGVTIEPEDEHLCSGTVGALLDRLQKDAAYAERH